VSMASVEGRATWPVYTFTAQRACSSPNAGIEPEPHARTHDTTT
jgi:hypothetical protein